MPFDIKFSGETADGSELGNTGQYGEIVLGNEKEGFLSLVGYWSPRDYQQQWEAGVRRLVDERKNSCLITSLHDPQQADVLTWWLLYPVDDKVHVQNALLMLNEHREDFSTRNPYKTIPSRRQLTDDGALISEWILPFQDFVEFLRTKNTAEQ
jgi:hypothetical protein